MNFKSIFTSRLSLLVMIVMTVGVVVDGVGRLTKAVSDLSNQANEPVIIETIVLPQLSESDLLEIDKAYAPFINEKKDSKIETLKGMSAAEQASQEGELKLFFIGDNQLKLKAIIRNVNRELVAFIEILNIKSASSKVELFTDGMLVYGYKLKISKSTQVTLSKQQLEKLQQITLTMYKNKV